MKNSPVIEVCIDSIHSAIAAQEGGANRVELCDNLFDGGTTPSSGCIEIVRKKISIALNVMIRPRGGDFLYSELEFEIMKRDIIRAKELGAEGVVFGILNADGTVDKKRNQELVELARPLSVTFHRAFDMTPDPFQALKTLIDLKIDRLLTSGQEASSFEGAELIGELVKKVEDRIVIMPGGGISERNIEKIRKITNCKEFHVTGRRPMVSNMTYKKHHVFMGGELRQDEYINFYSDAQAIGMIKESLK